MHATKELKALCMLQPECCIAITIMQLTDVSSSTQHACCWLVHTYNCGIQQWQPHPL